MSWQDSLRRQIRTPKQLLVEGRTAEMFFREWIEAIGLEEEIEARDFGSISNLTEYLKVFAALRDVREKVIAIGIVRDAEQDPPAAVFQSVCLSFAAAKLTPPAALNRTSDQAPRTGVFVLPDCKRAGMLETLCWEALQNDPKFAGQLECVAAYIDCLRPKACIRNETKARIWTYLSGFGEFEPQLGRSAQAKKWDWTNPAFADLSAFLKSL
jgi:hypothetical protein